jgi:hypothetical protein
MGRLSTAAAGIDALDTSNFNMHKDRRTYLAPELLMIFVLAFVQNDPRDVILG